VSSVKCFINCRVYSSFKPLRVFDGFVIVNGRVFYVGSSDDVLRISKGLGGDVIDLSGRVVLPGFIDAHVHLDSLGESLSSLDLRGVRSIKELKERLRDFAVRNRGRYWVLGRGWDQELFDEGRWPTRWDVDEVVGDRPVVLTRTCGHVALLNTKALEVLEIPERFKNSPHVVRDDSGVPTGIIKEDVMKYVWARVERSLDEVIEDLLSAINHALMNGVTTVGFVSCDLRTLYALQLIKLTYGLPIRVMIYLDIGSLNVVKEFGVVRGLGDDFLKILGVKLFADGSLGARTALLTKPYSDEPDTYGSELISEDELIKIIKEVTPYKLQIALHAIGDKAIDIALNAYRKALGNVAAYRHRIEHASVIRLDQVKYARDLGIVVVTQPHFVLSDWWVVQRVGEERASWVYPLNTIYTAGIPMAFSTDSPVEPINPWETVYAAVSRGSYDGIPLYRYSPNEVLQVTDALHIYTVGSAYALFAENYLGTLEPGKYADFIIVDKDPLEVNPKEVRNIRILATYVNGLEVYSSKDFK